MTSAQKLMAILRLRCPRCGQGKLYRHLFKMNEGCSQCGMSYSADPGFFVGSLYPNYAATVVLVTGLYWLLVFGIGVHQTTSLWVCVSFIALFPFWFHRYARAIWMTIMQNALRDSKHRGK